MTWFRHPRGLTSLFLTGTMMIMRIRSSMTVIAFGTALLALSAAHAAPPRDLDRYAQRTLETFGAPGMSVTIVEQGQAPTVRSYGVRRMGEPAKFRASALGWNVSDYRSEQILSHGGGVPGSVTLVLLMPKRGVGFALMTNAEEGGALVSLQYRLLDHYLGLDSPDWIGAVSQMYQSRIAKAQETLAAAKAETPAEGGSNGPSLPLAKYAGRYQDAWYGAATIEQFGEGLYRNEGTGDS